MSIEDSAKQSRFVVGYFAIAIVVTMWTTFVLLSRHGAVGVLTPWDLAALRFGVSGLIMLPILLRRGLGELSIFQALALTVTAGPGFALFAYAGFTFAPAAHGAILMPGVLPLMVAVLSAWMFGEQLSRNRLLSLALIITGVILTAASSIKLVDQTVLIGDLLFLLAVTSWAIFTVLARRWQLAPLQATAIVAPIALLLYAPFYVAWLPSTITVAPWQEIVVQGAFQGVGAVIIVLLAYTTAVKHLGPQITTMMTAIVPGLASILAVPLLNEPLNFSVGLGLLFVSVGMIATVKTVSTERPCHPASETR